MFQWENLRLELTNLVLDVVRNTGHLVEKSQRLVHTLLNDTQVGQYLLHTSTYKTASASSEKTHSVFSEVEI